MARQKSMVQKRGQVTIPSNLREKFGIAPGDEVVFESTDNGILITTEKASKLARLNTLLEEMNALLIEAENERGEPITLEKLIEEVRDERGKILANKYGLDTGDA